MDICKIGGKEYAVVVTEIEENFNILYSSNTGRTLAEGAPMVLDPIGTYIGHKVTVKCKRGYEEEYDELFNYVMQPRYDGIAVKMVHNQTDIEYDAYISNGIRNIKSIDLKADKVYWGELQINIVPMKAQVLPK
jgi:hypothetical protein